MRWWETFVGAKADTLVVARAVRAAVRSFMVLGRWRLAGCSAVGFAARLLTDVPKGEKRTKNLHIR